MNDHRRTNIHHDERGITAIVVTAILMIIISITTLGFAQVAQREQKQALDNQLSTQAFYAAESGVNLAISKLNSITGNKTNCGASAPFFPAEYVVSAATDVHITCLMVQKRVPDLIFQDVTGPRVTKIKDLNGNPFTAINVSWQNQSGAAGFGCGGVGNLPSLGAGDGWNCGQPLLRIDLVPICESGACLSQDTLFNSQSTFFLYPITSGAKPNNVAFTSGSLGSPAPTATHMQGVRCDTSTSTPRYCGARIVMPGNSAVYAARISAMYGSANVHITASTAAGTSTLIEGQSNIDSTARAADVLKRVQTRVSSGGGSSESGGPLTITGTGLCKRYFVTDTTTTATGSLLDPTDPCGIN